MRSLMKTSSLSAGSRESFSRNCGVINPEDIEEYVAADGYKAIEKVLSSMTPDEVIEEIKISGLRGKRRRRLPDLVQVERCKAEPGRTKSIWCAMPTRGTRAHSWTDQSWRATRTRCSKAMLIGGYAMGCKAWRQSTAVQSIRWLSGVLRSQWCRPEKKVFSAKTYSDQDLISTYISKPVPGAFVCGEETALIASLEGERGMPRLKPPFPAQKGFWQKPTDINNVETLANVPWIIFNGGAAFGAMGTDKSKGTKVFALAGKIKKGGLVEVPMGLTLRDVIFGIGGGIKKDKKFKAVQMGGPSGGCIPAELIDTPVTYEDINETGAIVGSGGMIVMDEDTCMVDMARYFLNFTREESCGKCTYCRVGTKRMLEILERITEGKGREGDIELLEELAAKIKDGSMCGLGQTAPNPVLTTIKYFRNEYEDHIYNGKCTAGSCKALVSYDITDACRGCTLCAKKCPVEAISGSGERKSMPSIRTSASSAASVSMHASSAP